MRVTCALSDTIVQQEAQAEQLMNAKQAFIVKKELMSKLLAMKGLIKMKLVKDLAKNVMKDTTALEAQHNKKSAQ